MAWVILPENSVHLTESPKNPRLLLFRVWWSVALWPGCHRGEKSWWTHHQLWWTVHRIHTVGATQWCAEANTLGNCSRLVWRKQTLEFCDWRKVFLVFWVMLQAQNVWFSLEFWSDNFTVALFPFFSSSDQLGDQIRVISPYKPSICAGPVRVNIETELREFMRIDMGRWGENESEWIRWRARRSLFCVLFSDFDSISRGFLDFGLISIVSHLEAFQHNLNLWIVRSW